PVGNVRERDAGGLVEHLHREMVNRPDARCAVKKLVRLGLREVDQLADRIHRQGWIAGDHERRNRDERYGREVTERIIRTILREEWNDGETGAPGHEYRVAVAGRCEDDLRWKDAGAAAAIVDDERLAERLGNMRLHEARYHVGCCARQTADDQ